MNKPDKNSKNENAQMLPILVVGLVAIIAMAALILDGGSLLTQRREAQNAADAAALAGARILCTGDYQTSTQVAATNQAARDAATSYAVEKNGATSVEVEIRTSRIGEGEDDLPGLARGEVVVTTEVSQGSFFAKILNQNFLNASATAAAGCYPYRPSVVLPIAWSCRAPAAGSASADCDYVRMDWDVVKSIASTYIPGFPLSAGEDPLKEDAKKISNDLFDLYSSSVYIIMDSDKVCGSDITCDFNAADSINRYQLASGGNRGWLNLEGTSSGTPNLTGWIENGLKTQLEPHTWLSGIDGNKTPVYNALETRLDEVVWIPIFNVMCDELPQNKPACLAAAHNPTPPGVPLPAGHTDVVITGSPSTPVFHVVAFAPFFITCVHRGNKDSCPGFDLAQSVNPGKIKDNTNTVEGYFVDPDSLDSEDVALWGADLGIYTYSLTE